jgi:hypothetical protein
VVLVLLGIGTLFVRRLAPPGCGDGRALDRVSSILRGEDHLGGVFVNDVETVSGWYLSARHDCSAEVAEIRGNINASGMVWRQIHYRVVQQDDAEHPAVTVALGDAVPLAPRVPSLWKRVLAAL